jgi:hypothetical protein
MLGIRAPLLFVMDLLLPRIHGDTALFHVRGGLGLLNLNSYGTK